MGKELYSIERGGGHRALGRGRRWLDLANDVDESDDNMHAILNRLCTSWCA